MTKILYDWDSAIVTVSVPTHYTATTTVSEFRLTICQLADLIAGHLEIKDGVLGACKSFDFPFSDDVPDPAASRPLEPQTPDPMRRDG